MLKEAGIEYKKDAKDTSCMHMAITRGYPQIVEFLLKKTPKYDENNGLPPRQQASLKKRTN